MSSVENRVNPYVGFRPFERGDADRFFGRRSASFDLADRLGATSFVAVLGASGTGKSSLVQAGLRPLLERALVGDAGARWRVVTVRRLNDPIGALAEALADPAVFEWPDGPQAARERIEALLRKSSDGLLEVAKKARELAPDRKPLHERENLLILVDQFEELFRFTSKIRRDGSQDDVSFVDLLVTSAKATRESLEAFRAPVPGGGAATSSDVDEDGVPLLPEIPQLDSRVFVLLTLRSDFLGDCARYQDLVRWVNDGFYLVPFLDETQIREVVEGPVRVREVEFSPDLVEQILAEVGDDPALLPVLQHALMRTWESWTERTAGTVNAPIAAEDYVAAGQVDGRRDPEIPGALSKHLEAVYGALTEHHQGIARRLFQRLTQTLSDGRQVRRWATYGELCGLLSPREGEVRNDVAAVLDAFRADGRTFLSPADAEPLRDDLVVDVSHESLMWHWTRLRETWLPEEADQARIYDQLSDEAVTWKTAGGSFWYKSLYENPKLDAALDWLDWLKLRRKWHDTDSTVAASEWAKSYDDARERPDGFNDAKAFLKASDGRRLLRYVSGGILGLAVLAYSGWYGWDQRQQRLRAARAATINLAAAHADTDPLVAALVLAELEGQDDVDGAGLEVGLDLLSKRIPFASASVSGPVDRVQFSRDGGELLVVAGGSLHVMDVSTGEWSYSLEEAQVVTAAFGAEHRIAVFEGTPQSLPPAWSVIRIAEGSRGELRFNRDGTRFAAVYGDSVCTWRIADAARVDSSWDEAGWLPHEDARGAVFSSDGNHLITWSQPEERDSAAIRTWRLSEGANALLAEHWIPKRSDRMQVQHAAYDVDSNRLVMGDAQGQTRVWNLDLGPEDNGWLLPHATAVTYVSFGGDGTIVTISEDGAARVWLVPDDSPGEASEGEGPGAETASQGAPGPRPPVAPQITVPVTGFGRELLASVLRAPGAGESHPRFGGDPLPFSADILTKSSDDDNTIEFWRVASDRDPWAERLSGHSGGVAAAAVDSSGSRVATVDASGSLRLWDFSESRQLWSADASGDGVLSLAVNHDGSRIATGTYQGTTTVHDSENRQPIGDPFQQSGLVERIAWDHQGRWIATTDGNNAYVRSIGEATSVVDTIVHDNVITGLVFERGGDRLITASLDSTVRFSTVGPPGGQASIEIGAPIELLATVDGGTLAVATDLRDSDTGGYAVEIIVSGQQDTSRTILATSDDVPRHLTLSPDGRTVAIGYEDDFVGVVVVGLADSEEAWSDAASRFTDTIPAAVRPRFVSDSVLTHILQSGARRPTVELTDVRSGAKPRVLFVSNDQISLEELAAVNGTWVVALTNEGDVIRLPVAWAEVVTALRQRAARACLTANQRMHLLREDDKLAVAGAEKCSETFQLNPTAEQQENP